MRVSLVASALAAVTVANAVVITETLPPWGICYDTATVTSTYATAGVTTTVHDPRTTTATSTVFVYPTKRALPERALPALPQVTEFKARAIPPQARAAGIVFSPDSDSDETTFEPEPAEPETPNADETTIVEVVPCSSTNIVTPTITTSDVHITATATEWASTSIVTTTYTLCVDGHICG